MQKLTGNPWSADFRRLGVIASAASLVLCLAWIACMILLAGGKGAAIQLEAHPVLFRLNFASCLALTLVQVVLVVALGAVVWESCPVRALLGAAFCLAYVPLNASCYFLNGAVLPRILGEPPDRAGAVEAALAASVEMGGRLSLAGSLDVLGYGILGIGWIVMATALLGRSRLWSATAALMLLTGVACIIGALGLFLDSALLTTGAMAGGVCATATYALLVPAFRQRVANG